MKRPPCFVLLLLLALLLSLVGAVDRAEAQPVTNPGIVIFTPSPDHAKVTTYEFGYFAVGASAPLQTQSIAKGQLATAGADYSFGFPRLLFGTFEHRLRACDAAGVCSTWALADKQSSVLPLPPIALRVQ